MLQVLEGQEEPLVGDQSCQGGQHQEVATQIQVVSLEASLVAQDPQGGPEGVGVTGFPEGPSDALLEDMTEEDCSWKQLIYGKPFVDANHQLIKQAPSHPSH